MKKRDLVQLNQRIYPLVSQKVFVAMSGGVDSSTTAWLLKRRGFEVMGVFLNLGQVKYKESVMAAKKVAKKIGIPLQVIDIRKQFKKEVVDYFLKSYSQNLTPNPCIVCNQKIKFGLLLRLADKLKCDFIATGHYVRVIKKSEIRNPKSETNSKFQIPNSKFIYKLFIAKDTKKDQSYFLYTLTQKQLAKVLFPLGEYTKEEARKLADREKLPYLKKESQDICFLFCETNEFLKKNLKLKHGPIITTEGRVVGQHEGLPLYTIGQRHAIKIGGIGPFYVAKKDWRKNELIVTNKFDDSILYSDKLLASRVNWISVKPPKLPLRCQARIRYQQPLVDCLVTKKGKDYLVKFESPLRAITPGQSIVFYKDNEVLGGGVIQNQKSNIKNKNSKIYNFLH